VEYTLHNTKFETLARGIFERLFFVKDKESGRFVAPPQPADPEIFERRVSYVRNAIIKHCPFFNPIPRSDFPGLYPAQKRARYEVAVASLDSTPVSRRDARVNTFTKVEKVPISAAKWPVPRIIQPRDPRYNVSVGVFIKPMEQMLCKAVALAFGSPTIVKGLNANQVGALAAAKWARFRRPVAVSLDASRFDQHCSTAALAFEHEFYIQRVSHPEDRNTLRQLLSWQLDNTGVAFVDHKRITYSVSGRRMSGDMNTGLGNCLLASSLVKAFCDERGIAFELLNNGDDCVIICDATSLPRFNQAHAWFLEFGFNMVFEEPVYELEHVVFCQSNFVSIDGHYRQIRECAKAISKDSISLVNFNKEANMRGWLHTVGMGGLALNSGVPVLQAFYCMYIRNGEAHCVFDHATFDTGTQRLTAGMSSHAVAVSPESRYSFWRATGIEPDAQVALEEYYANLSINYGDANGVSIPPELLSVGLKI